MNDKDRKDDGVEKDDDDVYVIDASDLDEVEGSSAADLSAVEADAASPSGDDSGVDPLRAENQELRDRYLRMRADFENFRKRMEREKAEYYRYALAGILRELLPVVDNFERALSSSEGGGEEFIRGIELIYKQLMDVLKKEGLQRIEAEGQLFDPNIHEAVAREENGEIPAHTITDVLQPGYVLQDRLLRPAMVRVAVGGPEAGRSGTGETNVD